MRCCTLFCLEGLSYFVWHVEGLSLCAGQPIWRITPHFPLRTMYPARSNFSCKCIPQHQKMHAFLVLVVFTPSLANCTTPAGIALSVGGTRGQHLGNDCCAFGLDARTNGMSWDVEVWWILSCGSGHVHVLLHSEWEKVSCSSFSGWSIRFSSLSHGNEVVS